MKNGKINKDNIIVKYNDALKATYYVHCLNISVNLYVTNTYDLTFSIAYLHESISLSVNVELLFYAKFYYHEYPKDLVFVSLVYKYTRQPCDKQGL